MRIIRPQPRRLVRLLKAWAKPVFESMDRTITACANPSPEGSAEYQKQCRETVVYFRRKRQILTKAIRNFEEGNILGCYWGLAWSGDGLEDFPLDVWKVVFHQKYALGILPRPSLVTLLREQGLHTKRTVPRGD